MFAARMRPACRSSFSASSSLAAHAADWPEFMGPTRDQVSTETGLIDTLPPQGPPLLFEKPVGKGYSAPSVRGEMLVVHHRVGARGDRRGVRCADRADAVEARATVRLTAILSATTTVRAARRC